MNLRKWEKQLGSGKRPPYSGDRFERGVGGGVFHPDFMPFQEDAFTPGLHINLVGE